MNEENLQENIKDKAGNGKKKRGLAFYIKVALVFVLLIGLAMGISLYYVYHRLTSDDKFEQMLMTRISEAINMDVRFAKLEFAFPGFTIKDATIATDSQELKLNSSIAIIEVSPDLWSIFKGQLVLDSLAISSGTALIAMKKERPVVAAQQSASQTKALNLEGIVFPFNDVSASNLTLNYKGPGSKSAQSFVLKKASLQQSMLSSALPFNIEINSADYCSLEVSGNLYWPDTLNASIKISNINREKLLELVPQEHKSRLQLVQNPQLQADIIYKLQTGSLNVSSAMMNAEPGFALSGKAQFAATRPLTGSASLTLKPLDGKIVMDLAKDFIPEDLGLVLEQGNVAAELNIAVAKSEVSGFSVKIMPSALKARMAILPEQITLDKAVIGYDGQQITLGNVAVAVADSQLAIDNAQVALSPMSFSGDISATINFNKTWKLIERFIPEDARRVIPQGTAKFKGSASYKKAAMSVNGALSADRLHIQEVNTAAFAELTDLNLAFADLGFSSGKIDFKSLQLKGAGGSIAVSGTITNAADPKFAMKANGKIQLADFSALAASLFKLPVKKEQFAGEIALELALGGSWSELEPSGTVKLSQVKADLSDQGLLIKELNGEAVADKNQLHIKDLRAQVVNGNLQLSGVLKNFKKPEVAAEGSLKGADLQQIRDFIRRNFPAMPEDLKVSGQADLGMKITGAIAEPKVDGSATLKNASFFHAAVLREVEGITGPVTFNSNGLATTGLKAQWGSSHAVIKGQLNDWGKLISDFNYSVDPLDATDAAGFFLKDSGYELQGKGTGQGTISGALEKIKVAGVARLPSGVFSAPISEGSNEKFKFPFTDMTANFNYYEGVFSLTPAQTNIFAGKVIVNGKIFVSQEPIGYEFDTELQQIETAEFLKTNTKMAGALRGGLDGKGSIKGNTTGLDSINGTASLLMKKGAYRSPAVVKKIAEQLNAMHLASGTIDNLSGDYSIANGKISSKNTMATSKDGKMKYVGTIGLDASLDGTMYLDIARHACQSSSILKQLVGNEEFLSIPVSLKGSMTSPSVGMPLDRMLKDTAEKRLKKGLEDKAKEALGNLFGGKKKKENTTEEQNASGSATSPQTEKSEPEKIEKQLKDVGDNLKKIFKF